MINTKRVLSTVDISAWRLGADKDVAFQLVRAFQRDGFAYITGHGVSPAVVADVFSAAHSLFRLSPEQLDAVHLRHRNHYHGYSPARTLPDIGVSVHDDIFGCSMDVPTSYRGPGEILRHTPNIWPADLPKFRPALERYQVAMRTLADDVLSAVALGLSLPAGFFRERCTEPHAHLRLLRYQQRPSLPANTVSVGQHSDYEAVTILAQDDVGGLQVRGSDGWFDVPPVDNAFVLNAGDMLTRWTNGAIPATPHRVLTPRTSERYSCAFFYGTNYDVLIEPALPPSDPDGEMYEPIITGAFLWERFTEAGV
ncbi:2OG-Fe(II) oxygenase family protein [Micromonospora sp. NPDC049662]|uniref:isopenicillin N synthase family dioxygenase n=1 Tax=Micromonospora sp. NPDC049662 TaxID=3155397 RepID=UPI00343CBB28